MSTNEHLNEPELCNKFSVLYLNEKGRYVTPGKDLQLYSDGTEIDLANLPQFFKENIVLPPKVTDVFVWVHGWQNSRKEAVEAARLMFGGLISLQSRYPDSYKSLRDQFVPAFVIVCWPSYSGIDPTGYSRMRERAAFLTENGEAEFFLASLLGYLEEEKKTVVASLTQAEKTLRSRFGFYVHCLGHSFGGRFLTAAVKAAGSPTSSRTEEITNELRQSDKDKLSVHGTEFEFSVDNLVVFQMAAPASKFEENLDDLTNREITPLEGPVIVTFSRHDTANCVWHAIAQFGEKGIGCEGVKKPSNKLVEIKLLDASENYSALDFKQGTIVNVNSNEVYDEGFIIGGGAHGDIFYEHSAHLVLTATDFARHYKGQR